MPPVSENSRSTMVRSATREHLQALRAERLRRRKGALPPKASEDAPATEEALSPSDDFDGEIEETDQPHVEPFDEDSEDAALGEQSQDEADIAAPEDPMDDDPLEDHDDVALTDALSESAEDQDLEAALEPPEVENPSDAKAEQGLSDLPGAGPGLIWMLEKSGVTSVADLAQADPAKLREALGIVGEILDVEHCINWARDTQAEDM